MYRENIGFEYDKIQATCFWNSLQIVILSRTLKMSSIDETIILLSFAAEKWSTNDKFCEISFHSNFQDCYTPQPFWVTPFMLRPTVYLRDFTIFFKMKIGTTPIYKQFAQYTCNQLNTQTIRNVPLNWKELY